MGKVVMADSIAHLPEFAAWYKVIKDTLADIDLGKLLIYIIDTVDASLLPALAEQFDVLGYKGFKLAQTEFDQRQIIKRAIELHKYKGTEWAIKEALKSIGFADIELIKTGYDHWAKFGIRITNEALQLTDNAFFDITQMVKEYKRAVCVLEEIRVTIQVEDALFVEDVSASVLAAISAEDTINLSGIIKYDGQEEFDGSHDFSSDEDVATISEI
ncbi:phage tail protein [Chitinophaga sp. CF418]|uniref:phage tail protein n=1 Tax=Chitinophaga sp. CF418 TaxID=1855287 RepID=UPI0009166871|nr:phage tail protein [Chitinophaga sp. CF418]SHN45954.1 Phage tail protein (Tail_P2_I) [Chitinophaga sp. CF418]